MLGIIFSHSRRSTGELRCGNCTACAVVSHCTLGSSYQAATYLVTPLVRSSCFRSTSRPTVAKSLQTMLTRSEQKSMSRNDDTTTTHSTNLRGGPTRMTLRFLTSLARQAVVMQHHTRLKFKMTVTASVTCSLSWIKIGSMIGLNTSHR